MSTSTRMTTRPAAGPQPRLAPAPPGGPARGGDLTKILFVVPAALAIVALFGYPVVKNLLMSFQDYGLRTFFTGEAPVGRPGELRRRS